MTLSPAQAKARARAISELGTASTHAQEAIRHAMYNHRSRALRRIVSAGKALQRADRALLAWALS